MTTKAKPRTATTASTIREANGKKMRSSPDYKLISWKELKTSSTNPRRRFNEQTIQSLADSIRNQGILEPLIVRKADKKYEIVCGERRYRAAALACIKQLPCLVRELSDEQVLDIQIHENLHREDVHPMDEAYGYQFLQEKLGCDVKELSLRIGKSEGYVLNRLKLNYLIAEAQKDIDDEQLPLSYALELSKYPPDIQKLIYDQVYQKVGKYEGGEYVAIPVKGQTIPWKSFIEWIDTNIHRLLSKAPFDLKASNLRKDGLACLNCPDRTGAAVSLFPPSQVGKKDACLNPTCYQTKLENHVQVRRGELAELGGIDPSEVPIVRSWCYANGEGYFGTESAAVISGAIRGGNAKDCKLAVSGIDIEADNYGQTVRVCLKSSKCKIHWPSTSSSGPKSAPEKSAEEEAIQRLEIRRARREEIWNAKVAEAVRVRVFKQAAESFEKKFSIVDGGRDFSSQLVARFWDMTASGDSNNLHRVVNEILNDWQGDSNNGNGNGFQSRQTRIEWAKKLKPAMRYRILFLLTHGNKGAIGYGNNYASQKEVRELAAEFDIHYALIDAQVRLELCGKKHKQIHKSYFDAVQDKRKDAKLPYLFSEKWKARD